MIARRSADLDLESQAPSRALLVKGMATNTTHIPTSSNSEARIRVLHVVEAFGGGVFEQIRHLTARLPSHGVTVAIAYGERPETPARMVELIDPAVTLFPLPCTKRTARNQVRSLRALARLYAEWRPDVIHLHSSFAGLLGAVGAPRLTPTVYTPHGYSFTMANHGPLIRALFGGAERVIARRVTAIGAVSRSEAELATRVGPPAKVFVVDNGVPELDEPMSRRTAPHGGRRTVVAMGRLAPQQRPHETAQILGPLADVADVTWIGDGREPADREPMLRAGVGVTGWLAREEAVQRLRNADVYVHWAAWDGQPLSVLEAMAVDSVVIGSDIPALRDVVPDAQRFDTTDAAAAFIRAILSDERSYAQCLDAQQAIRGRYSANRMAAHWAAAYRELTQTVRQPAPCRPASPTFDIRPPLSDDGATRHLSRL
jgi:glycosyltransferase involved in cell wall biosynthesis